MVKVCKVFGFPVHAIAGTRLSFIDCAEIARSKHDEDIRGRRRCGLVVSTSHVERACLDLLRCGAETWDAWQSRTDAELKGAA